MDNAPVIIPLLNLALGFLPVVLLIAVLWRWSVGAGSAVYANIRMLVQLLAIGYVLTFIFETDRPLVIGAVVALMIGVSSWIALRPLKIRSGLRYAVALCAVGGAGTAVLALVVQGVLTLPRWFEPRVVVPLAGMVFANAMNTVSLAAERFDAERGRGSGLVDARRAAMEAALIPQINALLAVGLVSLPGMMTGQILSGVDPLIAARYQIMVMCMIFASGGLAAVVYLLGVSRFEAAQEGPSNGT